MTTSQIETSKGKIEYTLLGNGQPMLIVVGGHTNCKEISKFRPITYAKDEFEEMKGMTLKMRSYQGFDNDLDQDIDQEILKQIKCPTLILHSNFDNAVDISHPKNAKNNIKNSKLVTFNNHGDTCYGLEKTITKY